MTGKLLDSLNTIWKYTRFIAKNIRAFRASKQLYSVRTNLSLANIEIGKLNNQNPIYAQRVKEFNQVMVELVQGKWLSACAMEVKSKPAATELWKKAFSAIQLSQVHSQQLLDAVQAGSREPLSFIETPLTTNGTEILFAGDAPLVPEINPVVILQGSDFEMGYQYARQLVEIYGPWILQRKTGKEFSTEDLTCLRK